MRLITPRDAEVSSGIVCFEVDGIDAADGGVALAERAASARR